MAAEVAKRTQGTLTIAINPGGKVLYPGRRRSTRCATRPCARLYQQRVLAVDRSGPGFSHLPFTITDALMAKPGVADGVLALVRGYVEPRGLKYSPLCAGRTPSSSSRTARCERPTT